mmetsp:Transcript_2832/g.6612  ORF Transcript_2832/g.6612 Transcript_2832/m.6612 type:complete len:93 (+) Transcript_2832:184-462(+)
MHTHISARFKLYMHICGINYQHFCMGSRMNYKLSYTYVPHTPSAYHFSVFESSKVPPPSLSLMKVMSSPFSRMMVSMSTLSSSNQPKRSAIR